VEDQRTRVDGLRLAVRALVYAVDATSVRRVRQPADPYEQR
jgi:hypothetical protein